LLHLGAIKFATRTTQKKGNAMAQGSFHGRFVWQELMTEDTASAATFYSKVVGWHTQPSAVDPSYTQFGVGSNYYAGMMKLPDEARAAGAKPQWLPYIGAADLEATVAAAERLGGTVKRAAHDIPTIGRFAILADPQGAAFAVFKPAMEGAAPPTTPPRGSFAWMELATSNYEAAFDFYSKLFGWQAMHRMDMGPQGVYLIFGADGAQRGGIYKLNQERSSRPYWLGYAEVASADAAAAAATAAGGKVIVGPLEVPGGGRIVQVIDPSGAMFAVHAMPAAKPAAPPAPKPAAAATTPPAAKPPAPKPVAAAPAAPKPPAPTPPAPKPAAPAAAKPAAAPAKPAAAPAKPAPATAPAAARPAAKKAAPKKAAPKKKAAKKPAAKKAAAKKKKPAAKKVARKKAAGKKRPARKGAAKSARKSARKSAKKTARKPARKAGRAKRQPAKARRKK
jgi:predicted enzyme related to lactoylglutathione lyase